MSVTVNFGRWIQAKVDNLPDILHVSLADVYGELMLEIDTTDGLEQYFKIPSQYMVVAQEMYDALN